MRHVVADAGRRDADVRTTLLPALDCVRVLDRPLLISNKNGALRFDGNRRRLHAKEKGAFREESGGRYSSENYLTKHSASKRE